MSKDDAEKEGGVIPFPIMLGSVVAAVGYAGMVSSYYLAQMQLKEKLKIVHEQHEKFVTLHTKLGENGTCQGVLDSLMPDDDQAAGGMPIMSLTIMFLGCVLLGIFFFQEYNVAMKKKSSNQQLTFTFSELVGYRLDYVSRARAPSLLHIYRAVGSIFRMQNPEERGPGACGSGGTEAGLRQVIPGRHPRTYEKQ